MRMELLRALVVANIVVAIFVWNVSENRSSHAAELAISDLTYGLVDLDGDGEYTRGDDFVLEWLVENSPRHLEEALKTAKAREDGGFDISPYLTSITADKIEDARRRQGNR